MCAYEHTEHIRVAPLADASLYRNVMLITLKSKLKCCQQSVPSHEPDNGAGPSALKATRLARIHKQRPEKLGLQHTHRKGTSLVNATIALHSKSLSYIL